MKIRKLIFCLMPIIFLNGCAGIFDEMNDETEETSLPDDFPNDQQIKKDYSANKTSKQVATPPSIQSENTNRSTSGNPVTVKRGNVVFNPGQTYCTGESNNSRMKRGKPPFDVNCEIIRLVYPDGNNRQSVVMAYSEHRNHGYDKVNHRWSQHEIEHESNAYNSDYWKIIATNQKPGLQKEVELAGEKYLAKTDYADKNPVRPLHSNAVTASNENPQNSTARVLGINLPTTVSYLTTKLGKYDTVSFPAQDKHSSWGQQFEWKRNDGTSFYALGDDYSSINANEHAAVKYIELQSSPDKSASDSFNGFLLNKSTRNDIEKSVTDVKFNESEFTGTRGGREKTAIYYQENGIFTYFFFDTDGILVGIGRSTFYINQAGQVNSD
jgi:hypothetical protein